MWAKVKRYLIKASAIADYLWFIVGGGLGLLVILAGPGYTPLIIVAISCMVAGLIPWADRRYGPRFKWLVLLAFMAPGVVPTLIMTFALNVAGGLYGLPDVTQMIWNSYSVLTGYYLAGVILLAIMPLMSWGVARVLEGLALGIIKGVEYVETH